MGQYFTNPGESVCSVAVLDLDDKQKKMTQEAVLAIASRIIDEAAKLGLQASPWRSSGGHGVHLIYSWAAPQDAYSVQAVLKQILENLGLKGKGGGCLTRGEVECFPKQDKIEVGSYGNYVWLPLAGLSVPLLDDLAGLQAGSRDDAAGYEWPLSADVPLKEKPLRSVSPKAVSLSADLKKLEEMLDHVKFDVEGDYSRDLWLRVCFALHHATGGSEEGWTLFDAWSAPGATYKGPDDTLATWESVKNDGADGKAVITAGSLMREAAAGGWIESIDEYFEVIGPASGGADDGGGEGGKDTLALPPLCPIIRNERDHLGIARKIIADRYFEQETACLIRAWGSGDWFVYGGKCYGRQVDELIRNKVREYLSGARKVVKAKPKKSKEGKKEDVSPIVELTVNFDPTAAQISAVLDALKTAAAAPGLLDPPQWLGEAREVFHIVLEDGVMDVRTREVVAHTPRFFSVNSLPYSWGEGAAGCPGWLKFMGEVLPDQESVDCLQEIAGYLVSGDTSLQKMFLIKGLPRSGKGTIERVLRAMLGEHNVAGTTLNQIGEDFGLWPLIDKSAVFISEARNTRGGIENRMALAVERLLMISGEDSLLVNTKGGAYHEARLGCRVVMTANEVPALGDSTGAFSSRFITLATQGSWLGKEDAGLTRRLTGELAGILRWSLDGLERLRERGRFIQPESGAEVMQELADAQNPVRRFLKERCDFGKDLVIKKQDLYNEYRYWFSESGIAGKPTSENWFAKGLKSAYREITNCNLEEIRVNKNSLWEWKGVFPQAKSQQN